MSDRPNSEDPRVRRLLDHAPVGIYVTDGEGAWTYANTRACELIGQPSALVLGFGWTRWLHADDAPRVRESWKRAVRNRSPFRAEYCFVHPSGSVVRVLGQAVVGGGVHAAQCGHLGVLTDITGTRESESRLAQTLRHLEAVYRASPDMIFLHGPDGRLMDVNERALEWYGYTRQEMLTLPFAEFSGGCCSTDEAFRLLERARAGEELDFEWCGRRRNGEEFPVEVRLRRLGDGSMDGAPAVVAVVRDITAAKRAARALRESEEKYRATMDASVAGIYLIQDGAFRYLNPTMVRLFGYGSAEPMMGLSPGKLLAPARRNLIHSLIDGTGDDPVTVTCVRRDSTTFDALVWAKPMTYEGRPAVVGTLIDISRRREAEHALGESERRFKAITANLPGAVFQARAEDCVLVELSFVSKAAYMLFEQPVNGFRHAPERFLEVIHPVDRAAYLAAMGDSAATLRDWTWEGRVVLPDGRIKWVTWRATPRLMAGLGVLWDGVVLNISETKVAQEDLSRTRDRLRQLLSRDHGRMERQRTAIAGEIHDEFGSLLMALKMNLHAVSSAVVPSVPGLADRFEAMNGLIDDAVVTIRRIATELRPRILDDFGLVAALEWHTREFERHTGIGCELTSDMEECDLPADVATALFRILQESLTNVARHSGAQRVQVHIGRDNGDLLLMVRDDGCGVDTDSMGGHQAQGIFGMRERALHHGGTFEIQGAPGKGTVVAVRVPVNHLVARSG